MTPAEIFEDLLDRPQWQDDAICAQTDPEAFYPIKGGSTRAAKRVCMACPVIADCLQYALERREHYGIWGGLSERERRKLQTKTREACAPPPPTDPAIVEHAQELLAAGMHPEEIAAEIGMSERTVRRIRDTQNGAAA